jgi:glycosyltransferase involved in cell wall biosynthesis
VTVEIVMLEATGRGGIAQYTALLASALADAGARAHVVTRPGPELADRAGAFTVTACLHGGQPYAAGVRAICRLVRERAPAIVHIQSFVSTRKDAWLVARLRRLGARVVVTAHNAIPHEARAFDRLGQWAIYRAAHHVIVHNDATRRALGERFGVPARRLTVIPHGDYAAFAASAPARGDARARLGIADDAPLVLFFGAIRPYKGLDVLLDAFALVRRAMPRARLVVAGEAHVGDLGAYRAQAERLGIAPAVAFTDRYLPAEEVAASVRAADVAAFPYRRVWESGSLRVAIALRCPVVATRAGGIAEIIRDGDTGRLVAPGDAGALAGAIVDTLRDPVAAAARAARALDEETRLRSWPVVAARTLELYRRLASTR